MLKVIKKLCLIIMVVLIFGLTPMLNATSFFQEVGINEFGKIVETDKSESVSYLGDRFSVYVEYDNDEFEWITIPIEYMSQVFVDYKVYKSSSIIRINDHEYDYVFENGITKIIGLSSQISDSKSITSDVFYNSSFWNGAFLVRIQDDGKLVMVDYNCLLESENGAILNMSSEYINYVDDEKTMFYFYMNDGYQTLKDENFYKHDMWNGYYLIEKTSNGYLNLNWDEYIYPENGIDLKLTEDYVAYLNDDKTIFYIYMENGYQAKYPTILYKNHSDSEILPADDYIVMYTNNMSHLCLWSYSNFINNNIAEDGSIELKQNYDFEVDVNNIYNLNSPIQNFNLIKSKFFENYCLVYADDSDGDKLYFMSIDDNGNQVDIHNNTEFKIHIDKLNTLFIDESELLYEYDYDQYESLVKIKSFDEISFINGEVGKVIVEQKDSNEWLYYLYPKNSSIYYEILLDEFIPDLDPHSLDYSLFTYVDNNLYFEFITYDYKNYLFSPTLGIYETNKTITLTSTDITVERVGTVYSYYCYFNSNVDVDYFTRIKTACSYHREMPVVLGIWISKYDYNSFVIDITSQSTENVMGSVGKFISKNLFGYDDKALENISKGDYDVNGNSYNYRMRFLIASVRYEEIAGLDPVRLIYTLSNYDRGTIVVDELNPLEVDYIYQEKLFTNVVVDDEIVTPPGDDNISDDPYDDDNQFQDEILKLSYDKYLVELFNHLVNNTITTQFLLDNLIWTILTVFILLIILILLPQIIPLLFKFIVWIVKLIYLLIKSIVLLPFNIGKSISKNKTKKKKTFEDYRNDY